ncbi:hypothetical protein ACHAQH_006526 [Verticillium albo-atrum]
MAITYLCNRCGNALHTYRFINIFNEKSTADPDAPVYITELYERGRCTDHLICDSCRKVFENLHQELQHTVPESEIIMGMEVRMLDQLRNGVTWANPMCSSKNMLEPAYLAPKGEDEECDEPYYPPLEEEDEDEDDEAILEDMADESLAELIRADFVERETRAGKSASVGEPKQKRSVFSWSDVRKNFQQ